jgi:hypothetical protein
MLSCHAKACFYNEKCLSDSINASICTCLNTMSHSPSFLPHFRVYLSVFHCAYTKAISSMWPYRPLAFHTHFSPSFSSASRIVSLSFSSLTMPTCKLNELNEQIPLKTHSVMVLHTYTLVFVQFHECIFSFHPRAYLRSFTLSTRNTQSLTCSDSLIPLDL